MNSKNIFLVGMPASGKSSIGRLLAKQLRLDFHDLDDIIVAKEGKQITEIFDRYGEEYFREIESDSLREFIESENSYILATGGGAPCFYDNMELMKKQGITIFLDVAIEDLYNKLVKKGTQKRPLLKDKTPEQLREELYEKYEYRKSFYGQSKICLQQRLSDINDRVNQVIFAIKTLEK